METIASRDKLTIQPTTLTILLISDIGMLSLKVMQRNVIGILNNNSAHSVSSFIEIPRHFGLPVDHHRLTAHQFG